MKESSPNELAHPHALAKLVVPDPTTTARLKSFQGYLGASDRPDWVRLYAQLDFNQFIEFEASSLLARHDPPETQLALPGIVWLRADARVVSGSREPDGESDRSRFLTGAIAAKYLSSQRLAANYGATDQKKIPTISSCSPTDIQCGPTQIMECYTMWC